MPKYLEWDFDNPKHHRQRRRHPRPPLEGEILTPDSERQTIRIDVHHHSSILPQAAIVGAFVVVALILVRSPGALIMLAVLVPPKVWIVCGLAAAILVIIAIRERLAGRPF
jgi:hypothetical protein